MLVSAVKKAQNAVEGIAAEAAYGLVAILLACGAFLFAASGVAVWLATLMPAYMALIATSAFIGLCAGGVYFFGARDNKSDKATDEDEAAAASPLSQITKSLGSMGAPMDLIASGLFARQFKKAPISTVAATAAVGALLGMLAEANSDDN